MEQGTKTIRQNLNKACVIGFILGLICIYFPIALFVGPFGIFFSIKGIRQSKKNYQGGQKLAIIGLILSILFFIIGLINVLATC